MNHMGSNEDVFAVSGPKHMMVKVGAGGASPTMMSKINWDSDEHRRCIAACIVNGTYILEKDAQRDYRPKLAPAWWESFHFRLIYVLEDDEGYSFGAIFEYVPPDGGARRHPWAPRYVVAFRGTMREQSTGPTDMYLNFKYVINDYNGCGRYRRAREEVGRLLDSTATATTNVWLAGHSLGACIALNVGREMATGGRYVPAFLFNPPQVSLAPAINDMLPDQAKRDRLYATSYVLKAVLAKTVGRSHEAGMAELFQWLAPWVPELYVHEKDPICRGFMDYFEQRQRMLEQSSPIFRAAAEVAMRVSYRDMWASLQGANNGEDNGRVVMPHLLPSARLWKNSSEGNPHRLAQWWLPDSRLRLRSRQYMLSPCS